MLIVAKEFNPFNLIVESHNSKDRYNLISYESGKKEIIAAGFVDRSTAESWMEEKQLEYVLND